MGYIAGMFFTKLSKKCTTCQWKINEMAKNGQNMTLIKFFERVK